MKQIFIDILAFTTLFSGLLVITSKNPVISVVFLISVFLNAAGYLILTGINFLGISYIIVYVGAITVLFLFVIMMININLEDIQEVGSQYSKNIPLALSIAFLFIYEFFTIMPFTINNISALSSVLETLTTLNGLLINSDNSLLINIFNTFNPAIVDTTITNFLHIEAIGHGLYTYGASLLIICSLILLLSMIAPIFISLKSKF